ncbi:hypothetical protein [Marimonas arenosa]|uniref:hypothetical protein n=1 Tax=Marimonas arenosa TaxID=1795305 RepID=UPI0027D309AD|nr:hypothetical protein [Marimonas arenosa]
MKITPILPEITLAALQIRTRFNHFALILPVRAGNGSLPVMRTPDRLLVAHHNAGRRFLGRLGFPAKVKGFIVGLLRQLAAKRLSARTNG